MFVSEAQDSTVISAARHDDTGLGGEGRKEVEREHFPLDLGWLDDHFQRQARESGLHIQVGEGIRERRMG